MKYLVRVKPNSKNPGVEMVNNELTVRVASPAREGEANEEMIERLAQHFGVPKYTIQIKTGFGSRNKIVEIM